MLLLLLASLSLSLAWRVTIEPTGEEASVRVSIVNTFDAAVTLCTWNSPLDANSDVFRAKLFDIESPSGEATYIGILARKHPTLSDFITLQPGQTVQTTLNLFKGFHFPATGEYKIAMNTLVQFTFDELDFATLSTVGLSNFEYQHMTSNIISVQINTVLPAPVWGPAPSNDTLGNPAPRANCNTGTYVSQINTAGSNAITACTTAINYLSPSSCSSSLSTYITWFGACDATRYSTVKNCIPKIRSGLQASFPVDCSNASPCTSNTVAYVYPADSGHVVYLCAYFFRYPTANCVLDSQPGTFVHEMSHFNNVCGTSDVTYGQSNCKNLAQTNPNNAVRNAANYHYFTESCPR